MAVAAYVARIFSDGNARRILDVGCGPGKFCVVAGCLQPELTLHGIDRRRKLVRIGVGMARRYGATNVRFSAGDATTVAWDDYDGFYFFNPFSENTFEQYDRFDAEVDLSASRFVRELLQVETLLTRARVGTLVVTYHGLGGPLPSTYELLSDEKVGSGRVRAWVKRENGLEGRMWLESATAVIPLSKTRMRSIYSSLILDEAAADGSAPKTPQELSASLRGRGRGHPKSS